MGASGWRRCAPVVFLRTDIIACATAPIRMNIPRLTPLALIAAALAVVLMAAGSGVAIPYSFNSSPNEMKVTGGSTLHDWSCPIESLNGTFQADTTNASSTSMSGLTGVQVEVPVDAIQCDRSTMNEKLREALKMEDHPMVRFTMTEAQMRPLPDSSESWFAVDAKGTLRMAGEQRTVSLPVKGQRHADGSLRFVGSHTITLNDYDMERPSAMLGTIKVSEDVTVHFDVTATPGSD